MGIRPLLRWVLAGLLSAYGSFAMQAQGALYPGLTGEELLQAIRQDYTPAELLTESQAKDTLYARVFKVQDSVRCIYSGLARYLPPGADPSQWLYGSGTEVQSINLEHAWPQSKGAGEGTPGNRDMHHLYPSRTQINSTRGNFPFLEIPDGVTKSWYYRDQTLSTIPANGISLYSESGSGAFEPREQVKGDIARAMFYFWTIYREDAEAADPFFFQAQQDVFCAWHVADPADPEEIDRTWRIAGYEGNVPNPFILDCTLAERLYCPGSTGCDVTAIHRLPGVPVAELRYVASARTLFAQPIPEGGPWMVRVFELSGRLAAQGTLDSVGTFPLPELIPGAYAALVVGPRGWARSLFLVP